ncbi:fibronectin type III domain-containing protein [Phosphitispora fastidiosa]|uniref:fibronectin type III domain-containing protein n=1 Tax=Phosphitispora fastidiosa TaxID=2837202 RepID=UPI0022B0C8C1|nr:fibronectin type III domain-containing protein [Phosphitispora fastidiosa]MBU7005798.1 fibronectin type 3 domain-containing protein [Phosphitispora fastidiosa]
MVLILLTSFGGLAGLPPTLAAGDAASVSEAVYDTYNPPAIDDAGILDNSASTSTDEPSTNQSSTNQSSVNQSSTNQSSAEEPATFEAVYNNNHDSNLTEGDTDDETFSDQSANDTGISESVYDDVYSDVYQPSQVIISNYVYGPSPDFVSNYDYEPVAPETPQADKPSGSYPLGTEIALSTTTVNAYIYYTTDGSSPLEAGSLYTYPIELQEAITLQAVAVSDSVYSDIANYNYTIEPITFSHWSICNDGRVNLDNQTDFYIEAHFLAIEDITTIEYAYSTDGTSWISFDSVDYDSGVQYYSWNSNWYRQINMNLSGLLDGVYTLRATAANEEGACVEECQFTKDTVPPGAVTGLSAAPNADNTAMILNWTNPAEDFEYVEIFKYNPNEDEGYYSYDLEEEYDWDWLVYTDEATFIDSQVQPYNTYYYMVVAYDSHGNWSPDPPSVLGEMDAIPITLKEFYLNNDGTVNADNAEYYGVEAYFGAAGEITSIDYQISTDEVVWDSPVVTYDGELDYSYWSNGWYRYTEMDVSDLADGHFWVQATASDTDGNSLTVKEVVYKDTVADNVSNLMAVPNENNDAIILSWTNPGDLRYVEIYRWVYDSGDSGSGYWDYLDDTWGSPEINTYTDYEVYPYKNYTYMIVTYDQAWNDNEEADPPQMTGSLIVDGPITLDEWYLENDGKITASNVTSYSLNASFLAGEDIEAIDYSYSGDGVSWQPLDPYISYGGTIGSNSEESRWYRSVDLNLSGQYGPADGIYLFRAAAAGVDGNSLSVERYVYKDSTRPANVIGFTGEINAESNGFLLNWTNPAEDFDYVIVQRNSTILSGSFTGSSFNDTTALPGVPYEYKVTVVDEFGNRSLDPPVLNKVLPVDAPVFVTMSPSEGYQTRYNSVSYSAEYRDDKEITSILFEVSQDGETWVPLNAANATPGTSYNNTYSKAGTWDITQIGEAAYQIRATATNIEARSTTVSRWVYIDRLAPALPTGFSAASAANGIYLTWDQTEDARYYYLVRELNGNYNGSWYIYSPEHSYTDIYVEQGKTYLYELYAVDNIGNEGPAVTTFGEYYTGPALILNGGPEVATTGSPYNLTGTTEPGATVTVNGSDVPVDEAGQFSYDVTLDSAVTTLTVAATNSAGTHTSVQKVNLDSTAPYVFSLEPQDTVNDYPLLKGTQSKLTAKATDYSGSGVSRIDFQMSFNDGQTWDVIGSLPADKMWSYSWDYYDPVTGTYQTSWTGNYYWDSTVSVGVYGPPADTSYKFRAVAYDKAGTPSNGTPVRIWKINNTPPAAPANLIAIPTMEKVTLSWSANPETDLASTPYKIYRSVTPGSGYVLIGSSATTTYDDTSVSGGTTYYYVITAVDKAVNQGPYSNEVSSQPLPDNTAPVIKSTSPGEGSTSGGTSVSVSVSATDNSARGIKAFTYEYSTDQGINWNAMTGYTSGPSKSYYSNDYSGSKSWQTSGLSSGSYMYRITAFDYSNNTATVSRSVYLDVYTSPVQNLQAVPAEGAVVLSWDAIPESDCSGYEIYKSTYITGGFSGITTVGKDILTYRDTGVTLGKTYYYQVFAYDQYGNRSKVSPIVWSKPGDDMTPPVVTLIDPADGSLTGGPSVSFTARATDNKAVTAMDAVFSRDEGNTWEAMNVSKSGPYQGGYSPDIYYYTNFTWNTAGLSSGAYMVRVTAGDAAGNQGSADVTWTLDKTVSEVVYLSTTPGDASIKLDWQLISDSDANGYLISRSTDQDGSYSVITGYWDYGYWRESWLPASQKSYTNTGLLPDTTYYYKVISRDRWGNRAESAPADGTTWADELAPVIMSVEPVNGTTIGGDTSEQLTVYFRDNNGSAGATARIEYATADSEWMPITGQITGPSQGYYDPNPYFYGSWDLSAMASGSYTVRYVVYDGSGNNTIETVNYQIDRTAPQTPGNLTATYGSGSVSLVWEASASADVNYYRIFRANSVAGPYTELTRVYGRATVSYLDSSVESGLTYYYKVTAVDNFEQEGSASNIAAAAAIADDVPPVILGISPDNATIFGSAAQVTVRAEDNIALSRITLEYSADGGTGWHEINTIATREQADFEWVTTPLNGPVQVRAIARDSAGNVSDGNPVRYYTIDNQGPAQVTGVVYTPYATSVLLRWDDVPDADFAYFQVERKDAPDGTYSVAGTVSSKLGYEVKGLAPGTEYWFRVVAYDTRGNRGTPSDEIPAKTTADTQGPVITAIQPIPGYFTSEIPLIITAEDDFSVSSVTVQFSRDNTAWADLTTVNVANGSAREVVSYNWDVSEITEGSLYVRALAVDTAGNTGQVSAAYQYIVDRTAPEASAGLEIEASSGYLTISWQRAAEADVAGYNIYKSEEAEGPYILLHSKLLSLSCRDRDVLPDKTYYYKVSASDLAGNEGSPAGAVSAQLLADNEPPQVISMGPGSGATLPANPKIYVLASDNYRLARVDLEYLPEGSGDEEWTLIEQKEVDVYGEVLIYEWDTSGLTDGSYQVRATALDQAGNAGTPMTVAYTLNVDPPQKPVLDGTPGGWSVELSWTSANEPDLAGFRLYRGTVMGGPYSLLKQTTGTSYADTSLIPNQRYYYMVQAVDKYGNTCDSREISAVPTSEDHIAPVAEAGDDQAATVGMEVSFDGTLSKDNDRIARYLWDFGDGSTSEAAQPAHVYDTFGTYTVALTVYDPAGNFSSPDWMQVTVMPPLRAGSLEVRVLDDVSGAVISGASVVVQYPDGTIQKTYTNTQGLASMAVLPGDYKVYGYKTDFKPAATDAAVFVNQKTTATVRLRQGQLVVGELTVNRMTLDEIEAAGIDVNAPENQWVYEFEIHLAFNDTPLEPQTFMVNGAGDFVGSDGGGFGFSFSDGGEQMLAYPVAVPYKQHPEVRPTIAYMVIPGEARWLKEFFEVGLTLENTADPEFILAGSTAALRLPEGLALAPTRETQTLQIDLGEIAGGEKRDVKWIIRGDQKGEYNLEAQYDGILQPFGDPVQTIFRTEEPIRVWGDDALQMHVETQDWSWRGYPYHLRLGLENVSDVPVYNAALELKDYNKQGYIYAPNQELVRSIRELPAGETLWADYWLIPAVAGELDLSGSYVLQTGGNASIETDITSFAVPDTYKPEQCPVLEQVNDGFSVDLTWGSVAGAAGYRIYRVRDDLLMSGVAEMVYQAGPDMNRITLIEPYGAKDYIIMTLFDDTEVIRHAITGMSWENRDGSPVITVSPTEIRAGTATELLITVNSGGFPLADGTVDVGAFAAAVELDENGQARVTVTPQETGLFTVTAYDQGGTAVAGATVQVLPALEDIPAIPAELRYSAFAREVTLTWNPNTEADLAGYNVYQMINNVWTRINTEMVVEATYTVTGLRFGIPYPFAVTAVDLSGNESGRSEPVSVTLFREPSTIELDLGSAAIAGQPVDFRAATVAKSDVGEPVRFRITLYDKNQAQDIDLRYLEGEDGSYQPMAFDENGMAWFGPPEGFLLTDSSQGFRVAFDRSGVYGFTFDTIALYDDSVLNGVRKIVEVTGTYTAPVIRDDLLTAISAGQETGFKVTTTANSAQGAVVRLRLTLADPAQRDNVTLKYQDDDGIFLPLTFDEQGAAWFGHADGLTLADRVTEMKVFFAETGSYGYKLEIVDLATRKVLASSEKCIEVKTAYLAPGISDTLPARVDTGTVYDFTVSTKANSEAGTLVRVRVILADPEQREELTLKYRGDDGAFLPLTFDDQGVTWFGPAAGFPIADTSTEFKAAFAVPGTYGYTLEIVALTGDGAIDGILAATMKSVSVKAAYLPPVIADSLGTTVDVGVARAFTVSTTPNSDRGTDVRVRVTLTDPEQREELTLKYRGDDGAFLPLTFDDQGVTWFGPADGFPLADAVTELTVSFAAAGNYGYKLEIVELAGGNVLASAEKCVQAADAYCAPVIADTLILRPTAGTVYDFEVSTMANSDAGKVVRVKVVLEDAAQAGEINLQYKESDGTYHQLLFDQQGITWFGPSTGFPLTDTSTGCKVAFTEPGTYEYTLEIVELASGNTLAAAVKSVLINETYLPPVITDNLPIRVSQGLEQAYTVTTTAKSARGDTVSLRFVLANPAQRDVITLKYRDSGGIFQPLSFDTQGAAWFGPVGGFPLNDTVIEMLASFAVAGSYGYRLEIVEPGSGNVLAAAEKGVEVPAPAASGGGSAGGGAIVPYVNILPAAAPAITGYSDVSADYWAVNEIVYLSSNNILKGFPDGTFRPGNSMSRGELAALLARALDLDSAAAAAFPDVPDGHWAVKAVGTVTTGGLMAGYSDGTFRPDAFVTREEVVQTLYNALHYLGKGASAQVSTNSTASPEVLDRFRDKEKIPEWACEAAAHMVQQGYVRGVEIDLFGAGRLCGRDEVSVLLYKVMESSKDGRVA